ncbi:cobyrinate a,c-diamide synthase [Candidatus Oscillochloris fontis]|uniref:cobyrinate a,c-diamide synthase n=1 Tax=Candidatus Oscillochloris fontis TaxID=2496868 RepID=UPI0015834596|nr:cobyrinate a,c-diamide synthase [Candidatus Oscillochloris fontis]
MPNLPRLMLAAPMSGSGKTTITAGVIAALAARGLQVAPFKCGPDYIDPTYHALAAGRPCANLDAWMVPPAHIPTILARRAAGADVALIEGVMGLFDGYAGDDDTGSSAHIARLTNTPVVVVLSIASMARTAAALIHGLRSFDPQVKVVGVILNNAGSARHIQMVQQAIEQSVGLPVVGALTREALLNLPERHLGLVPTAEPGRWAEWIAQVRSRVEAGIDLDRLLELARAAEVMPEPAPLPTAPAPIARTNPTIAIARDEAFSFIYPENLELLEAAGAKLAFFSPMHDQVLPEATGAIYLCGGFPELYAETLSGNHAMLNALRQAAQQNMPIYAECGGLMYLTQAVQDEAGRSFPMVGVLPGHSAMSGRLTLGYRTVTALADSWLWRAGETMRGHEFHYSVWAERPPETAWLYTRQPDAMRPEASNEGTQIGNVLASYIHLHFLAAPQMVERFVQAASIIPIIPIIP